MMAGCAVDADIYPFPIYALFISSFLTQLKALLGVMKLMQCPSVLLDAAILTNIAVHIYPISLPAVIHNHQIPFTTLGWGLKALGVCPACLVQRQAGPCLIVRHQVSPILACPG